MVDHAHHVSTLHELHIHVDHPGVLSHSLHFQNEWMIKATHQINLVEKMIFCFIFDKLVFALELDGPDRFMFNSSFLGRLYRCLSSAHSLILHLFILLIVIEIGKHISLCFESTSSDHTE